MLAPLSWLRDFAPFDHPLGELTEALSNLGLVVEGVREIGAGLEDVEVVRILAIRTHPNAQRIRLVDVDRGDGQALQIACGATNIAVGDLVPLARIGALLPGATTPISRAKMRGEWSNGMLCSAPELGLAEDGAQGLAILPPGIAEPGTPIATALGITRDVVFDLDITPNRPDALSMAGVARDLAAALGVPFAIPTVEAVVDSEVEPASVAVEDFDLCPRFTGTVVTGVRVLPSPAWLAGRLAAAGMRAINNVVDVSNFVMLHLGQPNHAYDLDRLGGRGLVARRARPGETLTTLDGVSRTLDVDDCVISDAAGAAVGVGGIMGGASSEITAATTTVLVEAAYFTPMAIARTGKRLGLGSEARARFERGIDPEVAVAAVDLFVHLLAETMTSGATPGAADTEGPEAIRGAADTEGPEAIRGAADTEGPEAIRGAADTEGPEAVRGAAASLGRGPTTDVRAAPPVPTELRVRTARVNALLGVDLDNGAIAGYLRPLGFGVEPGGPGTQIVVVPTWRPDVTREVDVVEEVARLHGYRRITRTVPGGTRTAAGLTSHQRARRQLRGVLAGLGLEEAWTTTFLAPGDLERAGLDGAAVEVENPLDRSESILRTSLLPGLLKAVRFNVDRQETDVRLFEIGRTFALPSGEDVVPVESETLAIVVAGSGADARVAARLWAVVAEALRLGDVRIDPAELAGLHPTRSARIVGAAGQQLGAVGEIDPEVVKAYGLSGRIGWVELELVPLFAEPQRSVQARAISRYPASDFDLAFVVDGRVAAADVERTLRVAAGDLLDRVSLFDVYRSAHLGPERRSLAYHLRLRAVDRTLTEGELGEQRQAAIDAVIEAHGAELRA